MSVTATRPDPLTRWAAYLDGLGWSEGVTKHAQSWKAFLRAGSLGIEPAAARREVERRIRGAAGRVVPRDLDRQLARAYGFSEQAPGRPLVWPADARPSYCDKELAARAAKLPGFTWTDLMRRSPVNPDAVSSGQYLEKVFKPGESVVICEHRRDPGRAYMVGSRATWVCGLGSEEGIFYLSNPTDGVHRTNADGRESLRSEGCLTAYRHMVVESDQTTPIEWVRAMVQVPLPVAAVYGSGGKSVHFLLRVDAEDKAGYERIVGRLRPGLVRLGADPAAMSGVRLTRLPGAMRGERRQRLLYLDPDAQSVAIVEREVRK